MPESWFTKSPSPQIPFASGITCLSLQLTAPDWNASNTRFSPSSFRCFNRTATISPFISPLTSLHCTSLTVRQYARGGMYYNARRRRRRRQKIKLSTTSASPVQLMSEYMFKLNIVVERFVFLFFKKCSTVAGFRDGRSGYG